MADSLSNNGLCSVTRLKVKKNNKQDTSYRLHMRHGILAGNLIFVSIIV